MVSTKIHRLKLNDYCSLYTAIISKKIKVLYNNQLAEILSKLKCKTITLIPLAAVSSERDSVRSAKCFYEENGVCVCLSQSICWSCSVASVCQCVIQFDNLKDLGQKWPPSPVHANA